MGPKKGRRLREIEVPTESVPEFELGDTATYIQQRREEREAREREEEAQKQRKEEARREETHWQEEGVAEKRARTEKSNTETEAGGEAGTSQSRYKMGHMTNIYLTELDDEAIVDFLKDHKELYKTNNISRTKQGRSFSGRGSPTVTTVCQAVQDLV